MSTLFLNIFTLLAVTQSVDNSIDAGRCYALNHVYHEHMSVKSLTRPMLPGLSRGDPAATKPVFSCPFVHELCWSYLRCFRLSFFHNDVRPTADPLLSKSTALPLLAMCVHIYDAPGFRQQRWVHVNRRFYPPANDVLCPRERAAAKYGIIPGKCCTFIR